MMRPRRSRNLPHALALAGLALALAVLLAVPDGRASAHAALASSDPGEDAVLPLPPSRVTLTFTEPVEARTTSVEVTTPEGARVDRDDLSLQDGGRRATVTLSPLGRGTYVVEWRNVSSVDGHPLSGRFAFHVGERSSDALVSKGAPTFPSPLEPPARFLLDAGLLLAAGTLGVVAFVAGPARRPERRRRRPAPVDPGHTSSALRRLALAGVAIAVAGSALQLAAQVGATGASPQDVFSGRWGTAYAVRVLGIAATGGLVLLRRPRIALVPSAVALASLAATSHGAAVRGLAVPAVTADALHVLAVAVWVGGLPGLAVIAWAHRAERSEVAEAVRRFSTLALLAAGVAGLTGAYLAWLHVQGRAGLDTTYGRAVVAKVVFFAGLVALGAFNRRWSIPAIGRGVMRPLRRVVSIEIALGAGLVAAVAVMTSTFPAREATPPALPGGATTTLDGTQIDVRARPGLPGANDLTVRVADSRGRAVEGAAVTLRVAPSGQEPDGSSAAQAAGDGVYRAPVVFGARGVWTVFVSVAPRAGFDTDGSVRLEVGGVPPPRPRPPVSLGWKAFGWMLVVGGALSAAVADRTWAWRGRSRAPWPGAAAALAGVAVLVFVAPRSGPPTSLPTASPATLALGRQVYEANCIGCHGEGLVPLPGVADLRMHALMHSDAVLLATVRDGRPGTPMPAFRDRLSERQIGAVLTYIQDEVMRLEATSSLPASRSPSPAR